jgi:hypothetical protein
MRRALGDFAFPFCDPHLGGFSFAFVTIFCSDLPLNCVFQEFCEIENLVLHGLDVRFFPNFDTVVGRYLVGIRTDAAQDDSCLNESLGPLSLRPPSMRTDVAELASECF